MPNATENLTASVPGTDVSTSAHETGISALFVDHKSEITEIINDYATRGYVAFRTRLLCRCAVDNRRYGAVIVKGKTIIATVARCRSCASTYKWGEGGKFYI